MILCLPLGPSPKYPTYISYGLKGKQYLYIKLLKLYMHIYNILIKVLIAKLLPKIIVQFRSSQGIHTTYI